AVWTKYQRLDQRSVVFDRAHEWLVAHRPSHSTDALIHGDLRMGNVIVDAGGLAAVIDWELIHRGDRHEDLAWLCLKAWRFGQPLEVGGLGTIDELVGAYEAAGGRAVDRETLRWWLVAKTFTWGVGCMLQADTHLSGRVRSVDLAAVGRRTAEQEWDLIELLAPDACAAARAAPAPAQLPDDDARHGRPTARELLETVRELLTERVATGPDRGLAYEGRVAANVLAIVERELAQESVVRHGDDWETLALVVRDRLAVANPKHLTLSPTLAP
ncbi:MAG TPA: phosphotransferase, partial [Acidimicrobiia bacterium]|nr:phosphotransferase [Acidimicrobiia bacterium]